MAYALGGQIKKKELNEEEKMAFNLNRGIFCGKDSISLSASFYELPPAKAVFEGTARPDTINVYSVAEGIVEVILPDGAQAHGVSKRSGQSVIWTTEDGRVMGLHMLLTFNANIMHELIVMKLYENGKIDDPIKQRFIEEIYDTERPIMRHSLIKVVLCFLTGLTK